MADLQVADLSVVVALSAALARNLSRSASVRTAPKAPICKNPRRDVPSQNLSFAPHTVNMVPPSCVEQRNHRPPFTLSLHGRRCNEEPANFPRRVWQGLREGGEVGGAVRPAMNGRPTEESRVNP